VYITSQPTINTYTLFYIRSTVPNVGLTESLSHQLRNLEIFGLGDVSVAQAETQLRLRHEVFVRSYCESIADAGFRQICTVRTTRFDSTFIIPSTTSYSVTPSSNYEKKSRESRAAGKKGRKRKWLLQCGTKKRRSWKPNMAGARKTNDCCKRIPQRMVSMIFIRYVPVTDQAQCHCSKANPDCP